MRPERFRLEGHQVAIARGEMDQRLHSDALLAQRGEGDAAHAYAGHRAVADVDAVDPGRFQQPRALEHLVRVDSTWRIDFDADHKLARADLARQRRRLVHAARLGYVASIGNLTRLHQRLDNADWCRRRTWQDRAHRRDVFRRCPATPADDRY